MKKIHIFIITAPEQHTEYLEISNFIRTLHEQLSRSYHIAISLHAIEKPDPAGWEMEEYCRMIGESEMAFFLVFLHLPGAVRQSFDAAVESLRAKGSPQIYTYFRETDTEADRDADVQAFMQLLDCELGHYYSVYSHIDTIKLRILIQLKLNICELMQLAVEHDQLMMDGKSMLPLAHVAAFVNNDQLRQWKTELEQTETDYFRMKPLYLADPDDPKLCHEYSELAAKREHLLQMIADTETALFEQSLRMYQDAARGELTPRQREAYRLFEQGDAEGANKILDAEEIKRDFRARMRQRREEDKRLARIYIRELMTKIEILKSMTGYQERFTDITDAFEEILAAAVEYEVSYTVLLEYARFLDDQNREAEALALGRRMEQLYELADAEVTDADRAALFNFIGAVSCLRNMNPETTVAYYSRAIAIREKLSEDDPEQFLPELAKSYGNAGGFYAEQGHPTEAEAYHLKELAIWEKLCETEPEAFLSELSQCYNSFGVFYAHQHVPEKAEAYYHKAIAILEQLCEENPERYHSDLALSYNNAGNFYAAQDDPAEAEAYFEKATAIRKALCEENPERHLPALASSYLSSGKYFAERNDPEQAMQYFDKAVAILEQLCDRNPAQFLRDLATCYNNIGNIYSMLGDVAETMAYYNRAIAIRETLSKENPERYLPDLVQSYSNLSIFYGEQNEPEKKKAYLQRTISILETLGEKNPERFLPELAETYFDMSRYYLEYEQDKIPEAEPYCSKAAALLEQLGEDAPEQFLPELAKIVSFLGIIYKNQEKYEQAAAALDRNIAIYEQLCETVSGKFLPSLADSYILRGAFCFDIGIPEEAESYFEDATGIYEQLCEAAPGLFLPLLAENCNRISDMYFACGHQEMADDYFTRAVEAAERMPWHPACRMILEELEEDDI